MALSKRALSKRMVAFAGVVLFLSVLPCVYLLGAAHGARHEAGNNDKPTVATNTFEPIERLERKTQQLNQTQTNPSGKPGQWTVSPDPVTQDPFVSVFGSGDPFAQMQADIQAMQKNMDAMFDKMHAGALGNLGEGLGLNGPGLEEKDGAYVLRYQAQGLDKASLKVSVDDDTLSISGSHSQEAGHAKSSSSFTQIATLPGPVDASSLKTDYKDGVLTITMKKAPSAGTRSLAAPLGGAILN